MPKLSKEEQEIVDKRALRSQEIRNKLNSVPKDAPYETWKAILNEIVSEEKDYCEHGRSIWSSCNACYDLDVKLGLEEEENE